MRWISIFILIFTLSSCTALKPVIANKNETAAAPRSSSPHFIENITIESSGRVQSTSPAIINTAAVNTFGFQDKIPEGIHPLQFKYAILMDLPVESVVNLKLFSFIDEWYGTPYRFGGNGKEGIDCSAFSSSLMTNVFGIGLPRMAKDQYKVCEHVKRDKLEEGDLVFFHTTRRGISHVGVYLGNNKFVHASLNYGVTISDMSDGYYFKTFRGGGRAKPDNDTANGN